MLLPIKGRFAASCPSVDAQVTRKTNSLLSFRGERKGSPWSKLFFCFDRFLVMWFSYNALDISIRTYPHDFALFSWANLRSLQRLVAKEEMVLDVNVRERQVNGMRTLQLETLAASGVQCFEKVRR